MSAYNDLDPCGGCGTFTPDHEASCPLALQGHRTHWDVAKDEPGFGWARAHKWLEIVTQWDWDSVCGRCGERWTDAEDKAPCPAPSVFATRELRVYRPYPGLSELDKGDQP